MAVSCAYAMLMTCTETLSSNVPFISTDDPSIVHNGLNSTGTFDAGTTPAATEWVANEYTMSGGALTIDLTSLTGTNGRSVSLNGLRPRLVKIKNKATNANSITIAEGASNGYPLFGASRSVTLLPGEELQYLYSSSCTAVGSSDKTIDISGTGSQVLQMAILAG